MHPTRERFLLKEEERRRNWSGCALLLAGLGAVAALFAVAAFRLADRGPAPAEALRPLATFVAFLLALLGAGLWGRLRPRNYVSVDAGEGTVAVVRNGKERRRLALAEAGPLRHVVEQRTVRSGKSYRVATFHVARSAPLPELVLGESEDELETRRALERHARAWSLPYVKPSGETRRPEELDAPVFERLGSDEAVTTPLPQKEPSDLSVAWRDDGYILATSYRPPTDKARLLLTTLGPPALVALFVREPVAELFRPDAALPLRVFGGVVLLGAFVPGLLLVARTWRRATRPPVLRIWAGGVRFRGTTLPLRSIEDVERVPGGVSRLVSDAKILEIDPDFCDESERAWLHHEIRRLVVEAGLRTPAP